MRAAARPTPGQQNGYICMTFYITHTYMHNKSLLIKSFLFLNMLKSLDATLNTPDPANQVIQAYLKIRGAGLKQNSAGLRPSRN